MNEIILFSGIYLVGIVISSFSQVLLKKSADIKTASFWKQYLNPRVVCAYALFFGATLLSVYAYKVIPITLGAILGTLEYGLVAILSFVFFKERLTKKQVLGICLVIIGIIVYSIKF